MSRARPRHTTRVYRQQDTAILNNIGQPVAVQITAVCHDPGAPGIATVFFDQPVYLDETDDKPSWIINGRTVLNATFLAPDGRSMGLHMSGTLNIGDSFTLAASDATHHYVKSITNTYPDALTGLVTAIPAPELLLITSVQAENPTRVTVTFDAPVGMTFEGIDDALNNMIIASGTTPNEWESFNSGIAVSYNTASAITSGLPWVYTAGSNEFVSITGARLANQTGTIDPA
jgi:hypothetical protein